jgi:hypothetical protein
MKVFWRCLAAVGLWAAWWGNAAAHDSWLVLRAPPSAGAVALSVTTGDRFPIAETTVGAGALVKHGCTPVGASGVASNASAAQPLRIERDTPLALHVQATVPATATATGGFTCFAEMVSHQIEIKDAAVVQAYFAESRATPAVREAWAAVMARGGTWRERYTKHARLERFGAADHRAQPSGMGLDIVLEPLSAPPAAGTELGFTVLRDGRPLAGLAVELRSGQFNFGQWVVTDSAGRAQVRPAAPGLWLLRAIDLRVASADAGTFDSRFVTLVLEVAAPAPR